MKKKTRTRTALIIALATSLLLTSACDTYRAASPETTVPETAVADTTAAVTEAAATTAEPTVSPVPTDATGKVIDIEPIDTSIRTDLAAPALYTVTGKTATGKTAVWKDESRETASRYLASGDTVTVVAIVGDESRAYALLDTGEYVLLASLEVVPVATATPTATPKPTKAPTKTPTATTAAPTATTAAPTDPPPPPTTKAPSYVENCDAIKNQIVQYCIDNGLWFPDSAVIGGGSKGWTLGYASADSQYSESFINGKIYGDVGVQSVSCWIENGYIYISYTTCLLPAA